MAVRAAGVFRTSMIPVLVEQDLKLHVVARRPFLGVYMSL